MKNKAIRLLYQSPFTKLFFYEPKFPDKITYLEFCTKHYQMWVNTREMKFEYYRKWNFYHDNVETIEKCDLCTVETSNDYYSLYFLTIENERLPDYKFSFHTPYPIGVEFLPPKQNLPKIIHEGEQEGMFRFGRPIFDEEKVIFKEKEVIKYLEEAMQKFILYLE